MAKLIVQKKLRKIKLSYTIPNLILLGGFRKIAKKDYQLRHVRLSVCMEQPRSHWTDFQEILYFIFFKNLSRKFKFH